jgi:hypothetical protein
MEPEDEAHRGNHQCLKGFCLLRPKPLMPRVWWGLLINSKDRCSVTMLAFLPGMLVFSHQELWSGWWLEMLDLQIPTPLHLHLFPSPSQIHCSSPDFQLPLLCLYYRCQGLSLPALLLPSWGWLQSGDSFLSISTSAIQESSTTKDPSVLRMAQLLVENKKSSKKSKWEIWWPGNLHKKSQACWIEPTTTMKLGSSEITLDLLLYPTPDFKDASGKLPVSLLSVYTHTHTHTHTHIWI